MNKLMQLLAVALMLGLAGTAAAQGKVAVMSPQAAVLQTNLAKTRLQALQSQAEYKNNAKEFETLQKQFQSEMQTYQKESSVLSAGQREERERKLRDKRADLEHLGRKLQEAQRATAEEVFRELEPRFKQAVMDLVKAENIGLLLNRDVALHADPGYDITAKITQRLNEAK